MTLDRDILLIVLLLTSVIQLSSSEKVKLKHTLNRRQDGQVHASVFIGNATSRTIDNLSLQLDLDSVMDTSEELIGVQGLERDAKRNNTLGLSNCNDAFEALWSIFCPENGEELINIVWRTEWGGKENIAQRRTETADLLIVDGYGYYYPRANYYEWMQLADSYGTEFYGDFAGNFIISDDGKVFEGLGWSRFNYIYNGGLGPRSLIIGFVKNSFEPSAAAIRAFNKLVKSAICKKELSINYSLIPFYLIYDRYLKGNDTFEQKEMKTWHSYKQNLDFLFPRERVESIVPQIIPKEKWMIAKHKEVSMTLSSPIVYIAISQFKARCFFNCSNYLNVLERYDMRETIEFNFFLSEEGRVYEVMGWEETWSEEFQKKKVIRVGFLGGFHSYGPSKPMFLALNALIQDGLRSGKLSRHYNIISMTTVDPSFSVLTGHFLENEIRKLDRYTDKYQV